MARRLANRSGHSSRSTRSLPRPTPKAGGSAHNRSAEVIEMKVRWQDDIDLIRRDAGLCERVIEIARAVDAEDVGQLRIELAPDAAVDKHPAPVGLDQERAQRHHDPTAIVGRRVLFPQWPRDDTEHSAAVEAERSVAHGREL